MFPTGQCDRHGEKEPLHVHPAGGAILILSALSDHLANTPQTLGFEFRYTGSQLFFSS